MGLFFYVHSVALIEDLPIKEEYHSLEEFYNDANAAYNQVHFIQNREFTNLGMQFLLKNRKTLNMWKL